MGAVLTPRGRREAGAALPCERAEASPADELAAGATAAPEGSAAVPPSAAPRESAMSVGNIRKALQHIRKAWSESEPHAPMVLSTRIMPGISISQFCFDFVLTHHSKRAPGPH